MKLISLLFVCGLLSNDGLTYPPPVKSDAKDTLFELYKSKIVENGDLPDGRYYAIVEYYNYATYTRATYKLILEVRFASVVSIDFGNGGSVHSGYNSEGYYYTGGMLYPQTDYNGNIISFNGTVTVKDNNSIRTFQIVIS